MTSSLCLGSILDLFYDEIRRLKVKFERSVNKNTKTCNMWRKLLMKVTSHPNCDVTIYTGSKKRVSSHQAKDFPVFGLLCPALFSGTTFCP